MIGTTHFAIHMYTIVGSYDAGRHGYDSTTKGDYWVRFDAVDNSQAVLFVPTGSSFAEGTFAPIILDFSPTEKLKRVGIRLWVSEDCGVISRHNFNLGRIILAAFNRGRSPSGCTVEHVTNDPGKNGLRYVTRDSVTWLCVWLLLTEECQLNECVDPCNCPLNVFTARSSTCRSSGMLV